MKTQYKAIKKAIGKDNDNIVNFKTVVGILHMWGTNREMYKSVEVGPTNDNFDFGVDAKKFELFVNSAEGEIKIEQFEDHAIFKAEGSSIVLEFMYYNVIPDITLPFECMPQNRIMNFELEKNIFACIDTNNPKFEFNGLFISPNTGYIAATDTRRLGYKRIELQNNFRTDIIIPKSSLEPGIISDLCISECAMYAEYRMNGVLTRTRLIVGRYPEIRRIIPEKRKMQIAVNGNELKKKLSKFNDTAFKFESDFLYCTDLESNNTFKIECSYDLETAFKMNLNAKYLREAIGNNETVFNINFNDSPIVLSSGNNTVIMPIIMPEDAQIKAPLHEIPSSWNYSVKRATKSRVNKDKIIADLQREIAELKRRLEQC